MFLWHDLIPRPLFKLQEVPGNEDQVNGHGYQKKIMWVWSFRVCSWQKKWVWSISEVGVIFEEFDFILTLRTVLLKWVSLLHCDHISHEGTEPLGVDKVKITQEAVIKMEQDT